MKNEENCLKNSLLQLKELHQKERKIGIEILEILWAIEQRKAYSELAHPSLFIFCVRELGYSDAQAFQRIQAMWALKKTPEIKEKIETGSLNLTTVAQVHTFIRQEEAKGNKRSDSERAELFTQFENKTTKEVKAELARLKGEKLKMKLVLELDEETEILWNQFRDKTAHQTKCDPLQCLHLLLKKWKTKEDKQKSRHKKIKNNQHLKLIQTGYKEKRTHSPQHTATGSIKEKTLPNESLPAAVITTLRPLATKKITRKVSKTTRHAIIKRDGGKCTHCGSTFQIQIEHCIPFALGGTHDLANLKLLCKNCNLHQGIKAFGLNKMNRFA